MNSPKRTPEHELDALLAALPREQAPARDLWPDIERRLATPDRVLAGPRRRWAVALAAGVAVAAVGVHLALERLPPAPVVAASTRTAEPMRAVAVKEAEYRQTRAALLKTYEERLAMLAPVTRARIAADLATIRRAQEDLRDALASDPGSRVLLRLYDSAMQQEFDLYTTIGRNTEPVAERNRT